MLNSTCTNLVKSTREVLKLILMPTNFMYHRLQSSRNLHHKNLSIPPQKMLFPSRYHPGEPIENAEDKITTLLVERNPLSPSDWNNIREDVMIDHSIISDVNFSSIVMNCLIKMNSLQLAHSLMEYLKQSGIEPNFVTQLKYMSICSKNKDICDQNIILQAYEKVKNRVDQAPVLDGKTAEYLIHGLCGTAQWRTSFSYLKKMCPNKPTVAIRSHLAAAAIRHKDVPMAWEIITQHFREDEFPNNEVFMEFVLHASKLQLTSPEKSDLFMFKVLKYLQKKNFILEKRVAEEIGKYFLNCKDKWKVAMGKVSRNGACEVCQTSLQNQSISTKDFIALKNLFLEKSVKKSDIFINTTTAEFDRYIQFLERFKPFDLVIDGLNAAHTYQGNMSRRNLASHLLKIVNHLSKSYPNLLVFGRFHMKSYPPPVMEAIARKARIFLTNNISQDDPFLIYSALSSGPSSLILSSDLMRDHISRLSDPHFIRLFRRWQMTHQMFICPQLDNSLKFIEPLQHSISIQGDMQAGWHIPYDDKVILEPYEELNNWLCIQRNIC